MRHYWILALGGALPLAAFCQAPGGGTRGITPEEFVKSRPAAKQAAPQLKYRPLDAPAGPAQGQSIRQIGVTVWRLRPASRNDSGARILVQEETKTVQLVPERVGASQKLRRGDQVRLTIESAQDGYLYIVNRERYAGGAASDAYLIFPTTRTRSGDNRVRAGRIIDVPAQGDQPNYFTLRQSRTDQTGEELMVVIADRPIEGIPVSAKPVSLTAAQVAGWERRWSGRIERFELNGGAGAVWTRAEQEAGASSTRLLTQDEPSPQTIYRVSSVPGTPSLLKVDLRLQ